VGLRADTNVVVNRKFTSRAITCVNVLKSNVSKIFSVSIIRADVERDISKTLVLWCIDQLLAKDFETNKETTAVAMQQRGKHASTTTELPLETVFPTRSVQRGYKEDNWGDPVGQ
jgi:hypothetical protein